MSMPISSAASLSGALAAGMLLAACGGAGDRASNGAATPDAARETIGCAIGTAAFDRACTVDRGASADGMVLTLHHPDGGFRRLQLTRDGRGVIAADGAEPAKVRVTGANAIEVTIADARYRLPATVGPLPRP